MHSSLNRFIVDVSADPVASAYLNQYRMTYILTPYLETINNLAQAVVKMRIRR